MRRSQQHFVDDLLTKRGVANTISSPEEFKFIELLKRAGMTESDFHHQFCFDDDETLIVVDFFFPSYSLVVELDGERHKRKRSKKVDLMRDRICRLNGISTVRIKTPMSKEKESFWFHFFRELADSNS
jgi:very-short-patch-repair endonuclease